MAAIFAATLDSPNGVEKDAASAISAAPPKPRSDLGETVARQSFFRCCLLRDGLPKLKDFPKELGGSGEVVPE